MIIKDISKVIALNFQTVKSILLKTSFSENKDNDNFIEEEFFDNQNFRKIKKQLVYDIANARIQEIVEIILFQNNKIIEMIYVIKYF